MTSQHIPLTPADASAPQLSALLQGAGRPPLEDARLCLDRIAQREPSLGAWAYHDADLVRQQAHAIEGLSTELPLWGVPIGIKDIFDTADMPTAYGSALYAGHRPTRDAEAVARLRSAGALIAGKTVTTEFAYAYPGKTVNPHNALHTPGGSSSGSAAAVAAGMVPFALGSQTGGSTIRPSAYCGIVGFKPTHGLVPTAGMKPLAPSMDTVGIHARTVNDVARIFPVLCGTGTMKLSAPRSTRIAYFPGPHSGEADDDSRRSLEAARDVLRAAGFSVEPITLPADDFGLLSEAQRLIMAYEAASTMRKEHDLHRSALSEAMVRLLDGGERVSAGDYQEALTLGARWRNTFAGLLGDEGVLMTFSTPGEAPLLSTGTGSSVFNRAWSLMGLPCLTLPFGRGTKAGLPLGIQFVGSPHRDDTLLACAARIERVFEPFNAR